MMPIVSDAGSRTVAETLDRRWAELFQRGGRQEAHRRQLRDLLVQHLLDGILRHPLRGSGKRWSRRFAPSNAFSITARVRPNRAVVNTMSVG